MVTHPSGIRGEIREKKNSSRESEGILHHRGEIIGIKKEQYLGTEGG